MTGRTVETDLLVLRKTPYAESSLVVAGLSPAEGQVHFLVHGARKIGAKALPLVDEFRILRIEFVDRSSGLHKWRRAELVRDYTAIAHDLRAFELAAWMAKFILANTCEGVASTTLFTSMEACLRRMTGAIAGRSLPDEMESITRLCLGVAFLADNGQLPDESDDPDAQRRLHILLAVAKGEQSPPAFPSTVWHQLEDWALKAVVDGHGHLPVMGKHNA